MVWKEADARMAADEVLGRMGIDVPYLELLRFGENALYAFPEQGLVVRVARPESPPDKIGRTLEFVSRLADTGMPVSLPASVPGVRQPVVTSTGIVTLWVYYVIDRNCRVTAGELGGILRRFHDQAAPLADLVEPWEPFRLIRSRLAVARRDGIRSDLLDPLTDLLTSLESSVPNLTTELGTGVIHADAHFGNVMCRPEHQLLLIDFDQVCYGPREWDLVPTLVTRRRFSLTEDDYADFTATYGYDLRDSPHAATFIGLRELGMVTWLLQQYGTSAAIDAEIHLRVGSINEDGPHFVRWSAH